WHQKVGERAAVGVKNADGPESNSD
ncbi:hypothetical protein PAT3040_06717, partial [Paenibacillus agaridevorans]